MTLFTHTITMCAVLSDGVSFYGFLKRRLQHKKQVLFYRVNNPLGTTPQELLLSALSLFVSGVFTNDHDGPFSFDDFAFFANGLYRRSYFHKCYSLLSRKKSVYYNIRPFCKLQALFSGNTHIFSDISAFRAGREPWFCFVLFRAPPQTVENRKGQPPGSVPGSCPPYRSVCSISGIRTTEAARRRSLHIPCRPCIPLPSRLPESPFHHTSTRPRFLPFPYRSSSSWSRRGFLFRHKNN